MSFADTLKKKIINCSYCGDTHNFSNNALLISSDGKSGYHYDCYPCNVCGKRESMHIPVKVFKGVAGNFRKLAHPDCIIALSGIVA